MKNGERENKGGKGNIIKNKGKWKILKGKEMGKKRNGKRNGKRKG